MPLKIRESELEHQIPKQIRVYNKRLGRNPDTLPTWQELSEATTRTANGLNGAVENYYGEDHSILDFLRTKGFSRFDGWETSHKQSKFHLNQYTEIQLPKRERKAQSTVKTQKTHLNILVSEIEEVTGKTNILDLGKCENRYEKINSNEVFFAVFDNLIEEHSRIYVREITRTSTQFYDHVKKRTVVNHNPAAAVREEYWFPSTTNSRTPVPSDDQVLKYWMAAEEFPEREYIFKIIIITHIALGPRPSDILADSFNAREHVIFEPEPIVVYEIRKNNREEDLPDEVPILAYPGLFKEHIKRCEAGDVPYVDGDGANWDGSWLPTPEDKSGSMSDQTLRDWLQELEAVANTNFGEDGEGYISSDNFRNRWFSRYRRALREILPRRRFVTEEQGNTNLPLAEDSYVEDEEERADIRNQVRDEFEKVIPPDKLDIPTIDTNPQLSINHSIERAQNGDEKSHDRAQLSTKTLSSLLTGTVPSIALIESSKAIGRRIHGVLNKTGYNPICKVEKTQSQKMVASSMAFLFAFLYLIWVFTSQSIYIDPITGDINGVREMGLWMYFTTLIGIIYIPFDK